MSISWSAWTFTDPFAGTRIHANVTDPNSYDFVEGNSVGTVPAGSQGINCLAEWYPGEFTDGRTFSCDDTEKGHWAIRVFAGDSRDEEFSGRDFKVKFIHSAEPGQLIASFRARVEGEMEFKSGANGSTTYGCFSSGDCNAHLKAERKFGSVRGRPEVLC